jgi:hypothetical protein
MVFALFEIMIPRTNPTSSISLVFLIIIIGLYIALARIVDSFTTGPILRLNSVYEYLNFDPYKQRRLASNILRMFAWTILVHLVVHFLIWGRVKVTEGRWGKTGRLETQRPRPRREGDVEIVEVEMDNQPKTVQ